jgi:hypothetical protein
MGNSCRVKKNGDYGLILTLAQSSGRFVDKSVLNIKEGY